MRGKRCFAPDLTSELISILILFRIFLVTSDLWSSHHMFATKRANQQVSLG